MRKGKRDGRGNPFVSLQWEMIDTAAFRNLSVSAVWVYVMMMRQWKRDGKKGVVQLTLPVSHVRFRMGQRAFKAAVRELIDGGFIDLVEHGGLFGKAARYTTSERWRATSLELEADATKGQFVRAHNARKKTDGTWETVWIPNRPERSSNGNLAAYNARRRSQLRLVALPGKKRRDPALPGKGKRKRKRKE